MQNLKEKNSGHSNTSQCFYSHCIYYAGHSGWDPAEKEKFTRCEKSRRDHASSRLKGHDPGGNQCPVFYETRGRPKTTRGGRGIQTQPFLVYTQPTLQGMY